MRDSKGRFTSKVKVKRLQKNTQRRKLYKYFRKQGLNPKQSADLRSPIKAMHKYRQVKQSALRQKKKHPALKIPSPPLKLTKKQKKHLQRIAKTALVSSPVIQSWGDLATDEQAYRLENMRRFYNAVAKATGKKPSQIKKEFLRSVADLEEDQAFYDRLQEAYNDAVGKRVM